MVNIYLSRRLSVSLGGDQVGAVKCSVKYEIDPDLGCTLPLKISTHSSRLRTCTSVSHKNYDRHLVTFHDDLLETEFSTAIVGEGTLHQYPTMIVAMLLPRIPLFLVLRGIKIPIYEIGPEEFLTNFVPDHERGPHTL
jgi:hypothetical protein